MLDIVVEEIEKLQDRGIDQGRGDPCVADLADGEGVSSEAVMALKRRRIDTDEKTNSSDPLPDISTGMPQNDLRPSRASTSCSAARMAR